jgi:endonuclease YncB( thermonuclease family)
MRFFGLVRDAALAVVGLGLLVLPVVLSTRARGEEALPGPIPAAVTSVVDGDTIWAKAKIWVGQEVATKVRLADIDAPEIGARAKCAAERDKGEAAKAYLEILVGGRDVSLYDVVFDKYGARVDARIVIAGAGIKETELGNLLVTKGFAVASGSATPWCLN